MIDVQPQEQTITSDAGEAILQTRGLTVGYHGQPRAIENVSFSVHAGERVAIIGPNGAGKSTLVKAIMGLTPPQRGQIILPENLRLGYVPQHESVDWNFPVTVRDVVMMGRVQQIGLFRWPTRAHWRIVDSALARVDMTGLANRQIGELSGGQRRRAFIARALAQEARLLLLDEPFSGVDASVQASLMDTLDRLNADGLTIILTTHDLGLAFNRFDRVMALNRRVIAYGAAGEVFRPAVLSALYGGRFATWDEQSRTMVFIDDHHCEGC
ncbi:MAG: metal ABC transporter ATP-binding protein [Chloroflexi bacterium]|nr:metal ABC transporter ATP-binding protein [Chloroflexota bacterium]